MLVQPFRQVADAVRELLGGPDPTDAGASFNGA
jgi:hypothetical protein